MVHDQQQNVLVLLQANQHAAQKWAFLEVKRFLAFCRLLCGALQLPYPALRHRSDRKEGNFDHHIRQHNLACLAVHGLKYRAQGRMALDNGLHRSLENIVIKWPEDSERTRQVVSRCPRFQLIKEPESLLGKRCARREGHREGAKASAIFLEVGQAANTVVKVLMVSSRLLP